MYQDKKTHPSIWSPTDVCGTLCESCECNHDPNSTCAKELLAWRTQTKPLLFWTYAVLHRSRLLCAFGLLQSVLRKKYIYKTVMCMPLLILFFVLCKALITLVQLRKYLENSRTPAAYTRQGSDHHSEDDDVRSNMERRIQEVHIHADGKHPEKHADITLGRLIENLTSLRSFCNFVDTTRTYHKTRMEASLRQLLNTVLQLNEVKT
ncbi:unnamed protein product [Ixodes persulcatus]